MAENISTDAGGEDFARAARQVLSRAEQAGKNVAAQRRALEEDRKRLVRQAKDIERRLDASGGRGRNAEASVTGLEGKRTKIAAIDDYIRGLEREATAVERNEERKTKAVTEGTRKRQAVRRARVPAAQELPDQGRRALGSYAQEVTAQEAQKYRQRAAEALRDPRQLAALKAQAPPGYDVEAVLRRQAAQAIPKGVSSGLMSAADWRAQAIAQGANIPDKPAPLGSKLRESPTLRPSLNTPAAQKRLEDLRQRGLFTPVGEEPKPAPKITYSSTFLAEQKREAAAAKRAAEEVVAAEREKTAAVEEGARKRSAARKSEAAGGGGAKPPRKPPAPPAPSGPDPDEEANRIIRENNARMAAALSGEQRADLARRQTPTSAAEQAAAQDAVRRARTERAFTPLAPRSAGGGGRELTSYLREQEARGEARIVKEQEAQETRRLIAAEARERTARDRAAQAALESARAAGGPLPLVPRASAGGGGRELTAYLAQMEREQRVAEMRAAGRNQYPQPLIPQRGQYAEPIGPQPGTRRQLAAATREQQKVAAAQGEHAERLKYNAAAEGRLASSEARLTDLYRMQGAQLGVTDQAMRKHGALTTEFISQAAKGNVSYREWGYQIGATAGKFAGWTAVSIPVFAALNGVRRIGQGAIASSSGVQQLQRVLGGVTSSQAQGAFRDLSSQFNVPISDASDAVFQMAQVFHSLPQAVDAARAALYSFKVGGVDVATSVRTLTSIAQGFGEGGSSLLRFFDQINQAQNTFGIRIGDTEAGIARAAGTFRNAGGSFSYLLSLIATGTRATGRTGENIGTAIQRAVGFQQRPSNQQALREFGIDPTKGVESTFNQSFAAARNLQGPRLQQLATALSSPQYASYFVPILQRGDLFNRIQQGTSADASRGSAAKELQSVLGQLNEQIAKVGNGLERLGSHLAQSHITAPVEGLVGGLNEVLSVANNVFAVFTKLPGPIQALLVGLVQVKGALSVARRVGLGGALEGSRASGLAPFLIEPPARRVRRAALSSLDATVSFARDEQQRQVGGAARAAGAAGQIRAAGRGQLDAITTAVASQGLVEEEAAKQREAIYRRIALADERAELAAIEATEALRQTERIEIERAEVLAAGKGKRGLARDEAINQRFNQGGGYIAPSLSRDVPLSERVARAESIRFDAETGRIEDGELPTPVPSRRFRDVARSGLGRGRAAVGGLASTVRGDAAAIGAVAEQSGALAAAQATASTVATRGTQVIGAATQSATRLAGGIRALGSSVFAFIGPWGLIFAAMDLIPRAYEAVKGALDKRNDALRNVRTVARTAKGQSQQYSKAVEDLNAGIGPGRRTFGDLFHDIGRVFTGHQADSAETRRAELLRFVNRQNALAEQNARNVGPGGRPIRARTGLALDSVKQSIDSDYNAFHDGTIKLRELRRRVEIRLDEIDKSTAKPEAKRAARQNAQSGLAAAGNRKDFYDNTLGEQSIAQLSETTLEDQASALESIVGSGHATARQFEKYRATLLLIIAKNSGRSDKNATKNFADALTNLTQVPQQQAQNELQRSLLFARTTKQRDDAYDAYYRTVNNPAGFRGLERHTTRLLEGKRQDLGRSLARQAGLQRDMAKAIASGDFVEAAKLFLRIGTEGGKQSGLQAIIGRLVGQGKQIRKAWKDGAEDRRAAAKAVQDQQYEDQLALRQAETAVGAHSFAAGAPRLRYEIGRAGGDVQSAIRQYGRHSTQALQAIQQQQDLQDQLVDQVFSDLQADAQLAQARFTAHNPGDAVGLASLQAAQARQLQRSATTREQQRTAAQAGYEAITAGQQAAQAIFQANQGLAAARFAGGHLGDQGALLRYAASQAHGFVDWLRSHGTKGADLVQAMQGAQEADNAVAEYVQEQAQALVEARGEFRQSLTDNPIRQAREQLRTDQQLLQFAKTPADRLSARAKINNDRRNLIGAQTDRRLEDINYEHDIGKLTDEAWIAAMRRVLSTLKKGSEARRQLRMEIGRAKHDIEAENDSELELNVGDIRLPSVYEVRRLASQGLAAPAVVTQSNVVNVNGAQNPEELGRQFAGILRTANRASMRAAGMRG